MIYGVKYIGMHVQAIKADGEYYKVIRESSDFCLFVFFVHL